MSCEKNSFNFFFKYFSEVRIRCVISIYEMRKSIVIYMSFTTFIKNVSEMDIEMRKFIFIVVSSAFAIGKLPTNRLKR